MGYLIPSGFDTKKVLKSTRKIVVKLTCSLSIRFYGFVIQPFFLGMSIRRRGVQR
jgi:hypothetical protein